MGILTHPIQVGKRGDQGRVPQSVTMKAYEVYCHVFVPQPELVKGNCRGGFDTGELIGFLYAATFPKKEWRTRFDEAVTGMENV